MEVNGEGFLEEFLSIGRATWETNPSDHINGFFSSSWGFDGFSENPAATSLVPPPPLPPPPAIQPLQTSYDCFTSTKPYLDCSFNEFYCPFEANQDLIGEGAYYGYKKLETTSFPAQELDYSVSVIEDEEPGLQVDNNVHCLEMEAACGLETPRSKETPADFKMGSACTERRSRAKKVEGQPSKNLMAERRRRKRLNDRLSMLRSIVPKISKMDRTSILGDTIDYMKELLERINSLREEIGASPSEFNEISIFNGLKQNEVLIRNSPKFEVERRSSNTRVEICCSTKPGLLLSTVATLEALGLEIQQCVISCFNDFSLHAACSEDLEQRKLVGSEDMKQALFRNAGYGGRCL